MAESSSLNFAPVLHNITAERVVFCYRDGDADSLEVANYYCTARALPASNLIALPCSSDNVISESDYTTTIETPLLSAISAIESQSSSGANEIFVIILGYNVPHIYLVDGDPYMEYYAIASRLHRLGHSRDLKITNFTFDRRGTAFKYFDADDASQLYITAVIDAPTKDIAKRLIDRSTDVDNQTFVTGNVYVDPYGRKDTSDQIEYEESILDFVVNQSPNLGLTVVSTVDNPVPDVSDDPYYGIVGQPYQDPLVDALQNDSFYWGWYTDKYSSELFLNQNERRVFLYNADDTGASDISASLVENVGNPWVNLAINVEPGYACTAGAVSAPDENAYLRPRVFFETLHRGATIGEAFLFASQFVDWKMVLIGDPLMVVNFPVDIPTDQDSAVTLIDNNESIRRIKESLEEAIAYGARQDNLLQDMLETNTASSNFGEQINLFYGLNSWRLRKSIAAHNSLLSRAVQTWLTYILETENLTLATWLSNQEEKTSILLNNLLSFLATETIPSTSLYAEGHWSYDFVYTHTIQTFEGIHFQLQLADDSAFSSIVLDLSSLTSITGWKYESETDSFTQLSQSGFPSSLSGRRIRFDSPEANYLPQTNEYYVRWRALDAVGTPITAYEVGAKQLIIAH